MFDCYEPVPALACPFCSADLGGWQGKRGPCHLLTWKQRESRPVLDDDCAKDHCLPDGELGIYTSCEKCGQWVDAEAIVSRGLWVSTRFDQSAAPAIKTDRIACAIDKFIGNCDFDQDPEVLPALQSLVQLYTDRKAAGRWPIPKDP